MPLITCHVTGRSFDPDTLPRNPIKLVPGTRLPADREAVDVLFPEPGKGDPRFDDKMAAREQALADVALYEAAVKEADRVRYQRLGARGAA